MLANFETRSRVKMLKVWGRRSSFNVQKVMWLIGELGLEHQHIDAGGRFGLDTSAFLAMNPMAVYPSFRRVIRRFGNRTPFFAIWPRVMAPDISGLAIWRFALLSTAGWTGRKPRCSRISWSACSGDSIEP